MYTVLFFSLHCYAEEPTNNIESQKAAQAWLDSTTSCILDVRDHDIKYEVSHSCRMSVARMHVYLESFNGMYVNPDEKAEYLSMKAQKYLWMARALSATPPNERQNLNLDAWR
jgi:hypothetical protein